MQTEKPKDEKKKVSSTPKPYRKTTLCELGGKLPIGVIDDHGKLHKDLKTRPWRMKEERELGKLRSENDAISVGQWVSLVIGTMYTRFGNHDFESMKPEHKRVLISQFYMPDVFYAFLWLRREAVGSELGFDLRCPVCNNRFSFPADLDTLEVQTLDDISQAEWDYKLKAPIQIQGKLVESLHLGPTKWATIEGLGVGGIGGFDSGTTKAGLIHGSILNLGEHGAVPITHSDLDDLVKRDIEALSRMIDEKSPGPNMEVEAKCPRCRNEFRTSIQWMTDDFFAPPSQ
jgi:hypothetical protein